MKLDILSYFAMSAPGDPDAGRGHYVVHDADSRVWFAEFRSCVEAALYLAAMRPELESRPLPPLTEHEIRKAREDIELMEQLVQQGMDDELRGMLRRFIDRCDRRSWNTRLQDAELRIRLNKLRDALDPRHK